MQKKSLSLALALVLAQSFPVSAQDDARALDEVVVTANRTAVPVRDLIAAVEVIDREAIERSQARSLQDLLQGRAGLSIANQGGDGKLTSLFVRGSESDHVLVLVDGVRVGSATSGQAALQDLPLELIERVEIVRGPRSSLYGSEAIGGVVQVFTRRSRGGIAPRLALGAGSDATREASAGIGGRVGRGWFDVDATHARTDGIDACRGFFDPVTFAGGGCFANEPDRDGYERDAVSLRGGVELGERWTLDAHALRAEADNAYDGSFVNRSETVQQVVGGSVAWTPSPDATLRLAAGRNRDASDNFLDALDRGYFDTDRDTASLEGSFTLAGRHRVTAGADWQRDAVRSDTAFARTSRTNRAAFAQYLGDFGRVDLEASARHDDNAQFGGFATGGVGVGVDLAAGWRASAAWGRAFKAPTFNELYFPFGVGNPALDPERSRSLEAGIAWRGDRANARLDAYRTDVDDLIAFDSVAFTSRNVQRARLRGAELTLGATVADWVASASLSVVDAENRSTGATGDTLPRRASRGARVEIDRAIGNVRVGLTARGEGSRYDDFANMRRLGGFGTVDLRAEVRLADAWRLQARVANVFDRAYETVEYYRQPGRTWFLTLRYAPAP